MSADGFALFRVEGKGLLWTPHASWLLAARAAAAQEHCGGRAGERTDTQSGTERFVFFVSLGETAQSVREMNVRDSEIVNHFFKAT